MKTRTLALLLCAMLVLAAATLGTIAYMTDASGALNRFTVGDVDLWVDETAVDTSGAPIPGANRVEQNDYHLLPGHSYAKDPRVTVAGGSESCYVRMLVTVNCSSQLGAIFPEGFRPQDHLSGWDAAVWPCVSVTEDASANTVTYELRYHNPEVSDPEHAQVVLPGEDDLTLPALFTALTIPDEITGAQLATLSGLEIRVVGQAIQAAVFPSANEAWIAFEEQVNP